MTMKLIVALMTCHNRREKTVTSIGHYFSCDLPEGYARQLVLVDDGSTDGTAEAVLAAFPGVAIERGDGNLFWNRGMLCAWQRALPLAPDYVLWLNDDTMLYPHALKTLLETDAQMRAQAGQPGIAVGSTDNAQGELSYGGSVSVSRLNRLKTRKVMPAVTAQPAETMNGNCVLVPREVFNRIGLLDVVFRHAMGDNDYGFRAHKAGIPIWVMPGFCGQCNTEERIKGTYSDKTMPFSARWKNVTSPKGLPPYSWLTIAWRYAGPLWPLVWGWPYFKIAVTSLLPRNQAYRG